ncbi:MAG: polysulfide reductase NrfD [Firmicutes bacterium]|nr:polysulfide reductase NrfD [Bacillota bacterium]
MFDYNLRLNSKTTLRLTFGRLCLLAFGAVGVALMGFRLLNGLGYTDLSDAWPWGLWIYMDLVLSALGSCGFAVGILAHVLHLKAFQPLARRALLVSFLSYLMLFLILFVEIGRWDNFYWIFISFAWSSPLYEVFICLTLYFLFQAAELGEIWLEKYLPQLTKYVKFFMPFIVLIACILPFGQEAALGAIYLAMPNKLDVIWYSQALPWNCLISAFYGGLCFIALEYNISNRYFREKGDIRMMEKVIFIAAVVIAVNFVIKLLDLTIRGAWGDVFSGTMEGNMFLIEMVIGSVIPMVIGFSSLVKQQKGQIIAAVCGVLGIMLNRFNFIFTGMADHAGNGYFPTFLEWGVVIGLGCLMVVMYLFIVENLPIFQGKEDEKPVVKVR